MRVWVLVLTVLAFTLPAVASSQQNLARRAHASASEFLQGMPPELAIDGNQNTRWSGIPGHNSGVWYELDWDQPISVGEVLVRQFQRFTFEWDVQVWDDSANDWRTVQHFGQPNVRLPDLVLCTIDPPMSTTKVRIANITNGPSFTEVEVYASPRAHPPTIALASNLRGNFVGMVCDGVGAMPIPSKSVQIRCETPNGPWTAYAVSDEHGLFTAKMPVGLTGQVVAISDGIAPRRFDAARFQRAITPLDIELKPTLLDKGWKFKVDPPKGFEAPDFDDRGWSPIKVPAHWEMEGFKSLDGIGGYRLHFRVPGSFGVSRRYRTRASRRSRKGRRGFAKVAMDPTAREPEIQNPKSKTQNRLMLRFDGVYSGADVWLNGKYIAHHEGGFTPFEIDVTDIAKPGDNLLALRVAEHTNVSDNMDKMSQYADFALAGIMRKVTLFRVPAIHVEGYDQSCLWNKAEATVNGRVAILNRTRELAPVTMRVALEAGNRIVAEDSKEEIDVGPLTREQEEFKLKVPKPQQWNAEHPYLYTLRIELRDGRRILQTLRQRIGLRQTTVKGSSLLINDTPVKIRGTCHHDQYPTMGRAVTPEVEAMDVDLIKKANLNALRTSHYPPMPELVQDADERGLYVEDECDFCWCNVADDLRNAPQILQLTGELLARDCNHPSVFMWSLCNESDFGYDFERSHEFARRIDPSRPDGAATSEWLEIATLHNPISIKRIQENENLDKPLLFDEAWCIYQGIFNDVAEMWVDPGIRDYYAEPLKGIWDVFMKSKVTQGSQIWAWSDDIFCVPGRGLEYGRDTAKSHFIEGTYLMPGRGLVGDAPWGVVDGWRREKPEFWITKKLQSPVKVEETIYVSGQETRVAVRNEYDFTNLSDLNFRYRIGRRVGALHPNVGPRSSGEIVVPAMAAPGPLTITVTDRKGMLVDSFSFPAKPKLAAQTDGPPLVIRDGSMLAGDSTHIIGGNFELAFDHDGGYLRECVRNTEPLLLEFPALHVLPTNSPTQEIPDRLAWHLDSMSVKKEGRNAHVALKGSYPDFAGGYDLIVTPGGEITVHSKFTYSGSAVRAREIGLRFSVPKGCTTLTWDRTGEWNVYPADHIGRTHGTAYAVYDHPQTVPPTWPYSEDNSPMGSNDFRSTKRHIRSASIAYANGAGVEISSDGNQALRAIMETDRISVNVSDWYGGTNVGYGEWIGNYGRGKQINPGDVLQSTLHLQLKSGGVVARAIAKRR